MQRTHDCSALSTDIDAVSTKLEELLTCFATCHKGYNCSDATDETIDKLGLIFSFFIRKWVIIYHSNFTEQDIIKFMEVYRQNFSTHSVLPKMHLLEDHIVPWMRRWKMGAGLMGEHGAESIHAHINRLQMTYCGVTNPVERLRQIYNMYSLETTPSLTTLRPSVKKRKLE